MLSEEVDYEEFLVQGLDVFYIYWFYLVLLELIKALIKELGCIGCQRLWNLDETRCTQVSFFGLE